MVLVMSVKEVETEVVVRTSYRVWVGVGVHAIHCVPGTRSRTQARRGKWGRWWGKGRAVCGQSSPMPLICRARSRLRTLRGEAMNSTPHAMTTSGIVFRDVRNDKRATSIDRTPSHSGRTILSSTEIYYIGCMCKAVQDHTRDSLVMLQAPV
ncbi:hypothetical protein OH76DRAFT_648062 [Lentinus brumalis]|uniref:Uncharacterized protein n=1 Tax=Lentinus brumalis TaxID=2498619 RepID=A0A371D846_9APHY|nr:hypothetical protein OH76DRAFT_648062 [Polyporus brumalis]